LVSLGSRAARIPTGHSAAGRGAAWSRCISELRPLDMSTQQCGWSPAVTSLAGRSPAGLRASKLVDVQLTADPLQRSDDFDSAEMNAASSVWVQIGGTEMNESQTSFRRRSTVNHRPK